MQGFPEWPDAEDDYKGNDDYPVDRPPPAYYSPQVLDIQHVSHAITVAMQQLPSVPLCIDLVHFIYCGPQASPNFVLELVT